MQGLVNVGIVDRALFLEGRPSLKVASSARGSSMPSKATDLYGGGRDPRAREQLRSEAGLR